jgi:hypothetical protein
MNRKSPLEIETRSFRPSSLVTILNFRRKTRCLLCTNSVVYVQCWDLTLSLGRKYRWWSSGLRCRVVLSTMKTGSSETLVTSYKTKRRHNTGYYNQWVHFYVVWISDLPFRTWTQNSQTPWDRIVLGKLEVVHLVKKPRAFYWTRRFITMFTRPLHHCESQIYAVDLCGMLSRSTRVERKYVYVSWNTAVSRFTAKKDISARKDNILQAYMRHKCKIRRILKAYVNQTEMSGLLYDGRNNHQ